MTRQVRIADVKAAVIRQFRLRAGDLEGPSCCREHAVPRHVAFWLLRKQDPPVPLPKIGRHFGRDHTSVISGTRSLEKRMAKDPELRDDVAAVIEQLDQLAAANSNDDEPTLDT